MAKTEPQLWIKLPADWLRRDYVMGAGPEGRALYLSGQFHTATQMTDGKIPRVMIPVLAAQAGIGDATGAIAALEDAGLWEPIDGGWQDTEYLIHNWSRAEYEAFVAQRRSNGKLGGRPRKTTVVSPDDPPPPKNHGGYESETTVVTKAKPNTNHRGYSGGEITTVVSQAKPLDNHRGYPDAPENHGGYENETKSKARIRSSSSDRDRLPSGEGDDDRDLAREDRAHAHARGAIIPLHPQAPVDRVWQMRCYRTFVASYPKGVPASVMDIWPEHCTSPDAFDRIMAGLDAWRKSRQWLADGNDFVTKPLKFLTDRLYDDPPLPWKDDLPPDPVQPPSTTKADPQDEAKRIAREMSRNNSLTPPTTIDAKYRLTGG